MGKTSFGRVSLIVAASCVLQGRDGRVPQLRFRIAGS